MSHALTENLKRLRCEKRLTQEQVAQRLGVSPQAVRGRCFHPSGCSSKRRSFQ